MGEERRQRARGIAELRYWFRWHLIIYAAGNGFLVALWYVTGGLSSVKWAIFPIAFWGLGLFIHYLLAYRRQGPDWIERETDRILREEEKQG